MKFLKENASNLAMILCEAAVGILLLVDPVGFTSCVIIALGAVLAIRGIAGIISYIHAPAQEAVLGHSLANGLIFLALGLCCMLNSNWFLDVFPSITTLFGIAILLTGIAKIQWVADCIRLKMGKWPIALVGAILTLVVAAIVIANPFATTTVLWTFMAVCLIAEAILDLVAVVLKARR